MAGDASSSEKAPTHHGAESMVHVLVAVDYWSGLVIAKSMQQDRWLTP